MLGLARASEYAGWWSGGAIVIDIDVATAVSQAAYQTPSFSWQTQATTLQSDQLSYNGNATARIDLTGYSSLTDYNRYRFTNMSSIYLNWPSGLSDGYYGTQSIGVFDAGSVNNFAPTWTVNIVSGQLQFGWYAFGGGTTTTLPGAYTDWTSKWLTIVFSCAETDSVYTNWNPTNTGSGYYRVAVYDTQAATLINKTDYRTSLPNAPDYSTMATSLPVTTNTATDGTNWTIAANSETFNTANFWYCFGTMWDPLSVISTDTTWLTTRPNQTIGTGVAWANISYTDLVNYSGLYYGIKRTNSDRYSQAQDAEMVGGTGYFWTAATVTQSQNTTNIPKDTS